MTRLKLVCSRDPTGARRPLEAHEAAVRKFRRLDEARTTDGSGLGLALARAVARLHGGELILEDNGPGLRAILELPGTAPFKSDRDI